MNDLPTYRAASCEKDLVHLRMARVEDTYAALANNNVQHTIR